MALETWPGVPQVGDSNANRVPGERGRPAGYRVNEDGLEKTFATWSAMLEQLAQRMRCSQCGQKAADVVAIARPRPRGVPKNPH